MQMIPKRIVLSVATLIAALLFISSPTMAEVITNSIQDLPVAFSVVNACNGETVTLSGTVHSQTRVTMNANTIHIGAHQNFQDVRGVGLTTGVNYVFKGGFTDEEN